MDVGSRVLRLLRVATALPLCALSISASAAVVFYDDFDDNDISNWNGPGLTISSPGPHNLVISGGIVRGNANGYGTQSEMSIALPSFSGLGGFAIEARSKAGAGLPGDLTILLASDSSYANTYVFDFPYGEGNRLISVHRGSGATVTGSWGIGGNAYLFNTHRIERDAAGQWSYFMNDIFIGFGSSLDTNINSFAHLAIKPLTTADQIDWIKVEVFGTQSAPEPTPIVLLVLGLVVLTCSRLYRRPLS